MNHVSICLGVLCHDYQYALCSSSDVSDVVDVVCDSLHICFPFICDELSSKIHLKHRQ